MYQDYKQVFGVMKELDIYSEYEDRMFDYLNSDLNLKQDIFIIKKNCQTKFKFRENLPFIAGTAIFELIKIPRKLLRLLRF